MNDLNQLKGRIDREQAKLRADLGGTTELAEIYRLRERLDCLDMVHKWATKLMKPPGTETEPRCTEDP